MFSEHNTIVLETNSRKRFRNTENPKMFGNKVPDFPVSHFSLALPTRLVKIKLLTRLSTGEGQEQGDFHNIVQPLRKRTSHTTQQSHSWVSALGV
jgi:hypothetical protein